MKSFNRRLPAAIFALMLGACFGTPAASAISVTPPTFTTLVDKSDAIVRGTVTDVQSRWVDNPGGHHVIKTFVTVQVAERTKGEGANTITLAFLGGRIGSDSMQIAGMPQFRTGERGWFFIKGNGRVFCPLNYVGHGAYQLKTDPVSGEDRVLRLNGAPLRTTAEVGEELDEHASSVSAAPTNLSSALTSAAFGAAVSQELRRLEAQRAQEP